MNSTLEEVPIVATKEKTANGFLSDVIKGLSSKEKYLESKYFYNENGDKLFQQIMGCPEYYLTRCEMEIFSNQTKKLASTFTDKLEEFDVVELGAGDASKSIFLLQELLEQHISFTYYPIDISKNVIRYLTQNLPATLPAINIHGLNGEYFTMLEKAKNTTSKKKVVLFLGSNIGNVPLEEAKQFCTTLRSHLSEGDMVLIGFDLKKDSDVILDAYNDGNGYTRDFNLNLLQRINDELGADFKIENFKHCPVYKSATGACKSYLESLVEQEVNIDDHVFSFKKGEKIYMEISQKYSVEQTEDLAINSGFVPVQHFYDSKKWFVDAVWQCV
jgi:dimethylhistidine N-methyltransferase